MKVAGQQWISGKTNQLRHQSNGQENWIQPIPQFIAGETIQRGHAVSIDLDHANDSKIVKTNTLIII